MKLAGVLDVTVGCSGCANAHTLSPSRTQAHAFDQLLKSLLAGRQEGTDGLSLTHAGVIASISSPLSTHTQPDVGQAKPSPDITSAGLPDHKARMEPDASADPLLAIAGSGAAEVISPLVGKISSDPVDLGRVAASDVSRKAISQDHPPGDRIRAPMLDLLEIRQPSTEASRPFAVLQPVAGSAVVGGQVSSHDPGIVNAHGSLSDQRESWGEPSQLIKATAATSTLERQKLPELTVDSQQAIEQALRSQSKDVPAHTTPLLVVEADTLLSNTQQPQQAVGLPERVSDPVKAVSGRELLVMQQPLRSTAWGDELAQRLLWMANRQTQWAEISLNPPHLGSLEVHLSLIGNDASAYFFTPHPVVREVIDENLSRLRDLLANVGINLGQAQVGKERFQDRHEVEKWTKPALSQPVVLHDSVLVRHGFGLIDLYV